MQGSNEVSLRKSSFAKAASVNCQRPFDHSSGCPLFLAAHNFDGEYSVNVEYNEIKETSSTGNMDQGC